MADLPSNAPQMFQLPTQTSIPWHGNSAETVQNALNTAASIYQNRGQQNLQQQQINQQAPLVAAQTQQAQAAAQQTQIQSQIAKIDPFLKMAIDRPKIAPYLWPTIATSINQLSPDYQLDPSNPPADLKGYLATVNDAMVPVQNGELRPDQGHQIMLQANKQYMPPTPAQMNTDASGNIIPGGGVTSGPNQNMSSVSQPPPQTPQGGPTGAAPMGTPTGAPQGQPQQPPMLPGEAAVRSGLAAVANGPEDQQDKGLAFVKSTPEYQQMTNAGELRKQAALQYQTQGFQGGQNQMNRNLDAAKQIGHTYTDDTKDFQVIASNTKSFFGQLDAADHAIATGDTTAAAADQQTAISYLAHILNPGTGRPGNPDILASLEKTGSYGKLLEQGMNRAKSGEPMLPVQTSAFRQAVSNIYLSNEVTQTGFEQSAAKRLIDAGQNPTTFIPDYRIPGFESTSGLYPSQSSDQDPAIGHTKQIMGDDGNPATIQYHGGNKSARISWHPINGVFNTNSQQQ